MCLNVTESNARRTTHQSSGVEIVKGKIVTHKDTIVTPNGTIIGSDQIIGIDESVRKKFIDDIKKNYIDYLHKPWDYSEKEKQQIIKDYESLK